MAKTRATSTLPIFTIGEVSGKKTKVGTIKMSTMSWSTFKDSIEKLINQAEVEASPTHVRGTITLYKPGE